MPSFRRPDPPEFLFKGVTAAHEALYKLSGGRIGGKIAGMPVLVLTTTGRKSGQKRETVLTYMKDGDDVLIVASKGGHPQHPAWYLNLTANPEVEVLRGSKKEKRIARTASAEEKARLWPIVTKTYSGYAGYQERTDRDIPVVILSPA